MDKNPSAPPPQRVSRSRSRSKKSRDRSLSSTSSRRSSYHRGRYHYSNRRSRSRSRRSSESRSDSRSLKRQMSILKDLLRNRKLSRDSRSSRSVSYRSRVRSRSRSVRRSHSPSRSRSRSGSHHSNKQPNGKTSLMENHDGHEKMDLTVEHDSDIECLGLAGAAKEAKIMFSDPINPELAANWNLIASSGLSDKKISELNELQAVPSNCHLIQPPILNPELNSGINISDYVLNRDKQFVAWQSNIASSLAEIGRAISGALHLKKKMEISTIDISGLIAQCSSASQILLNLQHTISTTRRTLIASNLKSEVKRLAEESNLDTMLFGSDFHAKVKAQEEMSKVGKSFLNPKSTAFTKPSAPSFKKKFFKNPGGSNFRKDSLNYKSPLRSSQSYRRQSGRSHFHQKSKANFRHRR